MQTLNTNPIAKLLAQIEQNTRSERTAVLYKTRQELGQRKVIIFDIVKLLYNNNRLIDCSG